MASTVQAPGVRTGRSVDAAAQAIDVRKTYGSGDAEVRALDGVSVTFFRGEFTAIMGPSGSGKSTLMHCVAGLDTLTSGTVLIGDTDLSTLNDKQLTLLRRDRIGFVFQAYNLVPTLTVWENIVLPLRLAGRQPDRHWVDQVVATVGLGDRLAHRPSELSGGQQQRVAVARALASVPDIVFADEPTGNVDSRAGAEILEFIRRAVEELGQTVVMVTHDPTAAGYAQRVVFLADGRVVDEMAAPTAERVLDRMKRFGADVLDVTIKGLLAHKVRLAATGLAVMLGVAFMAGTLVLTDTIGKTFDTLFADVYDDTDAVVRQEAAFDSEEGAGEERGRVDATLVERVAAVDGVALAEGTIQGYARLVDKDGEAIGDPAMGAPTYGGAWSDSPELNPFVLVDGAAPADDGEVVIDKASADDAGYRPGDTATVLVQGPPVQVRVAGIARFGEADSPGGASYVLFTTDAAERLVAEPGKFDAISVLGTEGISQPDLADRIAGVVPGGVEVLTGAEITAESQDEIEQDLSYFNVFMLVFAVVALLVGSFMIFNTFSITVAQRTRENALLRAIGASKAQVLGSVLVEAFVVGLLASVAGLALGVAVAAGLKALLAAFGLDIPSGSIVFVAGTAIVSLVVGVGVTVMAAFLPARKAAKTPPVAAMRDVTPGIGGYGSKLRMVVGGGLLAGGAAALAAGVLGDGSNPLPIVGLGALLVFFGVSVLGRTIALPLSRAIGVLLPRVRGITGELARENVMRNPKRTAATASALMIGVALVGFITIVAESTKTSITAALDEAFTGDFIVDGGTTGVGGLDPALAGRIDQLPEVSAATGVRIGIAEIGGSTQRLHAVDPATAFDIIDVDPVAGSPADLDGDAIAVFEDVAAEDGLSIGDPVEVLFKDTGVQELTVAMIYGEDQPAGHYLVSHAVYEANVADQFDSLIFVDQADGVDSATALAAVEAAAADHPGADVHDRTGFAEEQAAGVNQLGLVYALLGLAIVIALLGISNTLALSILERTRELGLLRSIGMTRAQLRSAVRWESVIIALQGTILGLAIGVIFGWAMVEALADEGIDRLDIPVVNLVVVVVLAGLAGVLAAVVPARRAARLNVLHAITTE